MILLINICKEKLHYYEFVKPIEDILKSKLIKYVVVDYAEVNARILRRADKIIICGTSLADNEFLKNIKKFEFIKNFNAPILGICGGMQIIGLIWNCKINKKKEIGFFTENFKKDFLGLKSKEQVYHLHNNFVEFNNQFEIFNRSPIAQAIKHKKESVYGVLFHPEVRQKNLIIEFCNL